MLFPFRFMKSSTILAGAPPCGGVLICLFGPNIHHFDGTAARSSFSQPPPPSCHLTALTSQTCGFAAQCLRPARLTPLACMVDQRATGQSPTLQVGAYWHPGCAASNSPLFLSVRISFSFSCLIHHFEVRVPALGGP